MPLLPKLLLASCVTVAAALIGLEGLQSLRAEIQTETARKARQQGAYTLARQMGETVLEQNAGSDVYTLLFWTARDMRDSNLALQYARNNVQHSPADAWGWMQVVYAKSWLNQFDAEFSSALYQAFHYARYFDVIQLRLARLGARHWRQLSAKDRALLAQSFTYILQHPYRYRLLAGLFEDNSEYVICPAFARTEEIKDWCGKKRKIRQICAKRDEWPSVRQWCAERGIR